MKTMLAAVMALSAWSAPSLAAEKFFKVDLPTGWTKIDSWGEAGVVYEFADASGKKQRITIDSFKVDARFDYSKELRASPQAFELLREHALAPFGVADYRIRDVQSLTSRATGFKVFDEIAATAFSHEPDPFQIVERDYYKGGRAFVVTYVENSEGFSDRGSISALLDRVAPLATGSFLPEADAQELKRERVKSAADVQAELEHNKHLGRMLVHKVTGLFDQNKSDFCSVVSSGRKASAEEARRIGILEGMCATVPCSQQARLCGSNEPEKRGELSLNHLKQVAKNCVSNDVRTVSCLRDGVSESLNNLKSGTNSSVFREFAACIGANAEARQLAASRGCFRYFTDTIKTAAKNTGAVVVNTAQFVGGLAKTLALRSDAEGTSLRFAAITSFLANMTNNTQLTGWTCMNAEAKRGALCNLLVRGALWIVPPVGASVAAVRQVASKACLNLKVGNTVVKMMAGTATPQEVAGVVNSAAGELPPDVLNNIGVGTKVAQSVLAAKASQDELRRCQDPARLAK